MTSLITINTSKNLCYNLKNPICQPDTEIKVISVIGKARTGKSTFMNILISYLKGLDTKIFEMSDTIEHCTNGVDYYYLEDKKVLLLDFQGIYLGDSSVDCKLLLFAYLLSDMIIFNEKEMLSNMTLQQFEPMLSFIHYIDTDSLKKTKNPQLIFRISDIHLKLDPIENRNNMLKYQSDQFQSIRDCISELFDDLTVLTTYCLERSERKLLNDDKFIELLESKENGFENAIENLIENIDCLQSIRSFGQFTSDVNKIIKLINNQEKIDYTKLDVTTNLAKVDIHDYINNIDKSIYNEIIIDGTQKLYDDNVETIIIKKDKIIKDIYTKFCSVPKQIVEAETQKYFIDKIMPVIEKAQKSTKEMSFDRLQKIILKHFDIKQTKTKTKKQENTDYKLTYNFGESDRMADVNSDKFIKPLEQIFEKIEKESKILFKSTFDTYIISKNIILQLIMIEFNNQKDLIFNKMIECNKKCDIYMKSIKDNFEEIILNTFDVDLDDDIDDYYTGFIEHVIHELTDIIKNDEYDYNKIINLTCSFDVNKLIYNQEITTDTDMDEYDDKNNFNVYYQSIYERIKYDIEEYIKSRKDDIYNLISNERKEKLYEMKGKIAIDEINLEENLIILNNPKIQFVKFVLEEDIEYLMTYDYYVDTFAIDLENICKNCENEGYVNDWNKFVKKITDIKVIKNTTVYIINFDTYKDNIDNYRGKIMMELFELEFKKYFARNKFIFKF